MLQDTAQRLDGMSGLSNACLVICNEAHRFLVAEQMRQIGRSTTVVLEPEGRNTAPAIALAAGIAANPETLLLVMPADHVIADREAFQAAVAVGAEAARAGKLVTFGIVPTRAETGYGYVRAQATPGEASPVDAFVEKPSADVAEQYLASGEYFWNSGMFLFSASAYLGALTEFAPDIARKVAASLESQSAGAEFVRPDAEAFLASPSDSIDYAVMEKTRDAVMVPLDAGWSDVGNFDSLHEARESDADGNTIDGDVVTHNCSNSFIQAENLLVAATGVDNLAIIQTKNCLLVADKAKAQDVKHLVDQLKASDREELKLHRQVFRPWGSYDSLENQEGFQVKRLVVNPGAVLSLQKHAHRAEHWVVVKGTARITRNDEEFDLTVNESTYIAIGDVHRIANPYDEPAHIIEVQCGDYLGEDDIVRLEDNYGREGTTS